MTEPTNEATLETLRFPIGRFELPEVRFSSAERDEMIERIASAPARVRAAVDGLDEAQLDTIYRPDGWTLRQVVHHLVDSHVNSYCRFKLTLTEENPTIRTYMEDRWAELPDGRTAPVEVSLTILDGLHERWTSLLRTLGDEEWHRTLDHPEMGAMVLDQLLALYAWHCDHHAAHIEGLRARKGW